MDKNPANDLEEAVCGLFKEPLAFALWSNVAGRPNPGAASRIANAQAISHKTVDGRLLRGYRLKARADGTKGFVLVAQGNAMLADQLLAHLGPFAAEGYDVYIFDYRGYGNSQGKRRLKAIVSDYRELFEALSKATEGRRLLYGISFGGIVLLNVIGAGVAYDRAVIDSSPSRVSTFGCPERYDPVNNLPPNGSGLLIISGAQDNVVPPRDSRELLDTAQARGAQVVRSTDFAHPFMDADATLRQARSALIKSFLMGDR
ncbi:MAG TPA: alpha/beta hydrolase [Candidatus Competibacteraceae bacterium]|nr:alpha/beta hydrolase [Candidatus Competibacteraceae bacterium]